MNVYVSALMIVGTRLSAGLLLNHITVMGQIMEQLNLKKDVNFKEAFLAYDVSVRRYWKKASSGNYKNFVLRDQMFVDFDKLTRIEREHPKIDYGTGAQQPSAAAFGGGKGNGKQLAAGTQCNNCGNFGHIERNCPQPRFKQQIQAVFNQQPVFTPQPKVVAPAGNPQYVLPRNDGATMLAISNGGDVNGGKNGKPKGGGKTSKISKGKR
jgi:hypothetical protein